MKKPPKGTIILIALIFIFGFCIYALKHFDIGNKYLKNINTRENMELIFFGLGEADSILIRHKGETLLIDTGETDHARYIIKSLLRLKIAKIDYLILTHPDKDHIGGAAKIVKDMDVGMVIQAPLQKGNSIQNSLNEEIDKKKVPVLIPKKELSFNMGEVDVKVFGPEKNYYKKSNDYSLLTLLTHGELRFFFGGDAEKKRLNEALKYDLPQVTLYKVPHHGRINKKSVDMIEKLSPKVAIITSPEADIEILNALKNQKSEVYYTSDKTIRFISDGLKLHKR